MEQTFLFFLPKITPTGHAGKKTFPPLLFPRKTLTAAYACREKKSAYGLACACAQRICHARQWLQPSATVVLFLSFFFLPRKLEPPMVWRAHARAEDLCGAYGWI
jgi:hypothetical protein